MDYTKNIKTIVSQERFLSYENYSLNTRYSALELYTYNMAISEAFYTPLCMLEIALRNKIDFLLSQKYGKEWFLSQNVILDYKQKQTIEKTLESLRYDQRVTPKGKVIAELSFGFWTAMFNRTYSALWETTLNNIARTPKGTGVKRAHYARQITQIRKLRNRIAHYEPIIPLDIHYQYDNIVTLIRWMSPEASEWLAQQSRFHNIYDADINDKVRQ